MNCNQSSGCHGRPPGNLPLGAPCPPSNCQRPIPGNSCQHQMPQRPLPPPERPDFCFGPPRYPVGMGYVPMQEWESPYPMEQGLRRGTIFPSLDYPFLKGRCRR